MELSVCQIFMPRRIMDASDLLITSIIILLLSRYRKISDGSSYHFISILS
jgi:hypothetical protein